MTSKVVRKYTKKLKPAAAPLTVRELKTWLDGYCCAHGDTWAPSAEQWELIKTKIFHLDDEIKTGIEPLQHATASQSSYTVPRNIAPIRLPERSGLPIPTASSIAERTISETDGLSPFA